MKDINVNVVKTGLLISLFTTTSILAAEAAGKGDFFESLAYITIQCAVIIVGFGGKNDKD
ncbi:hypothetical protein ACAS46_002748 [Vibrio vulnificus]